MRSTVLLAVLSAAIFSCERPTPPSVKLAPVADEVGPPWDQKTLYGYADQSMRFWIYPRFEAADMFEGDRARVQENGLWGIIDRNGDYVVPPKYPRLFFFKSPDTAAFMENDRWGLMTQDGELLFDARFPSPVWFYDNETAPAMDPLGSELYGYVDKSGQFVIQPQFNFAQAFEGAYAAVGVVEPDGTERLRYGFIDRSGGWVIEPKYASVSPLQFGLFTANVKSAYPVPQPNGEWRQPGTGIANLNGEWIHPPEYDAARILGEDKFVLVKNGIEVETDRTPVPPSAFEKPAP